MSFELRPRILVDGVLCEVYEFDGSCTDRAKKTFTERWGIDSNPKIVRMVHRGEEIDHWFYVSDQWIAQPYAWPSIGMQPYVGKTSEPGAVKYSEKNYVYGEDEEYLTAELIDKLSLK